MFFFKIIIQKTSKIFFNLKFSKSSKLSNFRRARKVNFFYVWNSLLHILIRVLLNILAILFSKTLNTCQLLPPPLRIFVICRSDQDRSIIIILGVFEHIVNCQCNILWDFTCLIKNLNMTPNMSVQKKQFWKFWFW